MMTITEGDEEIAIDAVVNVLDTSISFTAITIGSILPLVIVDNDVASVNVVHVRDGSEVGLVDAQFEIQLTSPSSVPLRVFYSIDPNTDVVDAQGFVDIVSEPVVFDVAVQPDNLVEGDETITLTILILLQNQMALLLFHLYRLVMKTVQQQLLLIYHWFL